MGDCSWRRKSKWASKSRAAHIVCKIKHQNKWKVGDKRLHNDIFNSEDKIGCLLLNINQRIRTSLYIQLSPTRRQIIHLLHFKYQVF